MEHKYLSHEAVMCPNRMCIFKQCQQCADTALWLAVWNEWNGETTGKMRFCSSCLALTRVKGDNAPTNYLQRSISFSHVKILNI